MKAAGFSYDEALEFATAATVKILLEHGADVNAKDEQGKLHTIIVTISIHPSIYLDTFICDYNSYNSILNNKLYIIDPICINLGETSLMKAAQMGYIESVRILLEHGADVNSKDESGKLYTIIVTISIYPPI